MVIRNSDGANLVLIERFALTESVESFLHLCDIDIDLLLYEFLDERIAQGVLQRKKNTEQRKSRGKGAAVFSGNGYGHG